MDKKRQKQIEKIALAVLLDCYAVDLKDLLENGGIDVEKVALHLGMELVPKDLEDKLYRVPHRRDEIKSIDNNSEDRIRHHRFAVAQDIGRYVLNLQRQRSNRISEDAQEREANAFAAALLMPRSLVNDAVAEAYDTDATANENYDFIQLLADKFNVSKMEISVRLTNLDMV